MRITQCLALLLLAGAAFTTQAKAEDCAAPCLAYSLSIDTYGEAILANKPDRTETLNIAPSNYLTLTATPVENLNVVADFILEPVVDQDIDHVNVFEKIGLYNDELYIDYTADAFYVQAGKFTPDFSLASAEMGGNYGSGFAANFDASESWVALAAADFEAGDIKHRLSAAVFTRDRSLLSESAFTNRGRTKLSDGGAGNAKGVGSAQLLWDGCSGADAADCFSEGDWGYRLGVRWQKAGVPNDDSDNPKDEWAYTAAAFLKTDMGGHDVKLIAEGDYTKRLGGAGDGLFAATLGTEIDFEPVTLYAAVELQNNLVAGAPNTTGFAFDIAADYVFAENWTLGAGYAYVDAGADDAAHYLNLSLTLDLEGNTGGKS
jgi:hypothetical protein